MTTLDVDRLESTLTALHDEALAENAAVDRGLRGLGWLREYDVAEGSTDAVERLFAAESPPDEEDCATARRLCPSAYVEAAGRPPASGKALQKQAQEVHITLLDALDAYETHVADEELDRCSRSLASGVLRRPTQTQLAAASRDARAAYLTASERYGAEYRRTRRVLIAAAAAEQAQRTEARMCRQLDVQSAGLEATLAAEIERSVLEEVDRRLGLVDWSDVQATRECDRPSEAALAVRGAVDGLVRHLDGRGESLRWLSQSAALPARYESRIVHARIGESPAWREVVHITLSVGSVPGAVVVDRVVDVDCARLGSEVEP